MPQFTGENELAFNCHGNPCEPLQGKAPGKALDAALRLKLAEFASFLDEIEDCTHALRADQLEQVIAHAVATCGFGSPKEARSTLEWMFHQPFDLS